MLFVWCTCTSAEPLSFSCCFQAETPVRSVLTPLKRALFDTDTLSLAWLPQAAAMRGQAARGNYSVCTACGLLAR